jgi:chromosome segregation ATPase
MASREAEIASIGQDQERVRENMRALGSSNEERQLVQRYVRQLDAQEDRIEALRAELAAVTAERAQAQDALDRFIAGLSG